MGVLTGFLSGHEKTSIKEGKFFKFFLLKHQEVHTQGINLRMQQEI